MYKKKNNVIYYNGNEVTIDSLIEKLNYYEEMENLIKEQKETSEKDYLDEIDKINRDALYETET